MLHPGQRLWFLEHLDKVLLLQLEQVTLRQLLGDVGVFPRQHLSHGPADGHVVIGGHAFEVKVVQRHIDRRPTARTGKAESRFLRWFIPFDQAQGALLSIIEHTLLVKGDRVAFIDDQHIALGLHG